MTRDVGVVVRGSLHCGWQPQPQLSPCPGLGTPVHPCSQLCSWSGEDPPETFLVQDLWS